jgi:catechol 2,3-dioxygenase-like lactoylglutathione lyase family enzyme
MIQTTIGHIQFNVHPQNLTFYKDVFTFCGWPIIEDSPVMLAVGRVVSTSLWFFGGANEASNDYDGPGMNHLGLHVQSQREVDQMVEYLEAHHIALLFDTPRHRPEFSLDSEHTYYQVMFESPDRILFEGVYMGLLAK